MLAPSGKLLAAVALLLPAVLLVPALPSGGLLALALYGLLGAIALLDGVRAAEGGRALKIRVPAVARVQRLVPGEFEIHLFLQSHRPPHTKPSSPLPQWVELAPLFAQQVKAEPEIARVDLSPQGQATASLTITGTERGAYRVPLLGIRWPSPMGFWTFRERRKIDCEVHVFPQLEREKRFLANLFLNRGLSGLKRQRQLGQGHDYDQLRDYLPGDSMLDIHWKASAKRQSLVTRTYQVERTQEIYVVIDHSRLSGRRLPPDQPDQPADTVLERFVTAASLLGLATAREGDLFGLITFSRQVTRFLRAGSGPAHLRALQKALFALQPQQEFPDFESLLGFIRARLTRRALIIFLTDLSDPAGYEHFRANARLIRGVHLPLVNLLQPAGVEPLFRKGQEADDFYLRMAGHLNWVDLRDRFRQLSAEGLPTVLLQGDRLAVEIVTQYLTLKQRQAV